MGKPESARGGVMTEWGEWIENTTWGRPRGVSDTDWIDVDYGSHKKEGTAGVVAFWHIGSHDSIRRYRLPAGHPIYKKDEAMNENKPSDAALERVREIYGWAPSLEEMRDNPSSWAADLKMAEELDRLGYKPPKDPLMVMAREICAKVAVTLSNGLASDVFLRGALDNEPHVQFALAKLREVKGVKDD
jgi:hypothetical protein